MKLFIVVTMLHINLCFMSVVVAHLMDVTSVFIIEGNK